MKVSQGRSTKELAGLVGDSTAAFWRNSHVPPLTFLKGAFAFINGRHR